MKNAGIYVRVSTERQALEGYSIAAQKANLIKFAQDNNFKIFNVYADEGISGKSVDGRPSVKRLIKDIEDGKIDVVLIQKFDRLTRNITDTEDFIQLFQRYDVDVWSISDGKVDISNSNGKFLTLLKGLFAQHEREVTAERIKIAFEQKARQGYALCGSTPYGYKRKKGNKIIVIDQEQAKTVRKIFNMYINNYSLTDIAHTLNDEGVPTKKGGQTVKLKKNNEIVGERTFVGVWMPKSIRLILSNPVYIGKVRYGIGRKDYFEADGKHKSIISIKKWNEVQERLSKIKTKIHTKRPKEDVYYCGTLVCGICGKRLTTDRRLGHLNKHGIRKRYEGYRCVNQEKRTCSSKAMSHRKVESAFMEYLEKYVEDFSEIDNMVIDSGPDDKMEEIEDTKKVVNSFQIKLKQVMDMFMVNKMDYEEFNYMSKHLKFKIKEYKSKLERLEKQYHSPSEIDKNKISKHILDHWNYLTNKEKFDFLTEFVDEIVIVNRDSNRNTGKAEVLNIKFYDIKKETLDN